MRRAASRVADDRQVFHATRSWEHRFRFGNAPFDFAASRASLGVSFSSAYHA